MCIRFIKWVLKFLNGQMINHQNMFVFGLSGSDKRLKLICIGAKVFVEAIFKVDLFRLLKMDSRKFK